MIGKSLDGVFVIEMGNGDVHMSAANCTFDKSDNAEVLCIFMKNGEPREIGIGNGEGVGPKEAEAAIIFKNVESLETFASWLDLIKDTWVSHTKEETK